MKEVGFSYNQQPPSLRFPGVTCIDAAADTSVAMASGGAMPRDSHSAGSTAGFVSPLPAPNIKGISAGARGYASAAFPSDEAPPSFSRTTYNNVNMPLSAPTGSGSLPNWSHQQAFAAATRLPSETLINWSALSNAKTSVVQYPSYGALNGGSLVLDSSRGELVNALQMTPKEILEAKALAASKSHSEAERRRRERINTHLATLRTILPTSIKTDKASLLAEVIDQVKRLKRQVSEVYEYGSTMPTENNELKVEREESSTKGKVRLRASLCCDDRPDLMTELKQALETLKLKTVRAEMATLGGRIKNVFTVASIKEEEEEEQEQEQEQGGEIGVEVLMKRLEEELKAVMERAAADGRSELVLGGGNSSSKRHRLSSMESKAD